MALSFSPSAPAAIAAGRSPDPMSVVTWVESPCSWPRMRRTRETDASKVALVHLVARLVADGFKLLDAQFITDHLTQFGTQEIPRAEYHRRLARALPVAADFQRAATGTGAAALQVISHAS